VVRDGGIAVRGGVEEEFTGGKVIRASDDELIGGKVTLSQRRYNVMQSGIATIPSVTEL
jgi:hypothetical protein